MSEDEKQAIEDLKSILRYKGEHIHVLDIDFVAIETILNLIEKQQKEIEELKADIKDYIESNNNWCDDSIRKSKVIDKMAQEIFIEYNPHFSTPEQVKEYFYKEIENE